MKFRHALNESVGLRETGETRPATRSSKSILSITRVGCMSRHDQHQIDKETLYLTCALLLRGAFRDLASEADSVFTHICICACAER